MRPQKSSRIHILSEACFKSVAVLTRATDENSWRRRTIPIAFTGILWGLEHFQDCCEVEFAVSHPFHKEHEMDGARSFVTAVLKVL
jgi:hypothetical protein